ncbi:MAG: MFS transporter, partial [Deltaproteobacteria bacterium]|nr:MFS transporter [Deltaproteobacteria bacterium]
MSAARKNKGWSVALGGLGINLALGILYTWSIFKVAIKDSIVNRDLIFAWSLPSVNDPYIVCCLVFAVTMILAGKLQDKYGPRNTAFIGGLLVGLGFIWISQTTNYVCWVLGFGGMVGAGIGFGYASATPPALKWFPKSKTGLIVGLVISGFGLAPVYAAPLTTYLLGMWGLQKTMLFYGVAFTLVVCGLAFSLVNPPPNYVPEAGDKSVSSFGSGPETGPGPADILKSKSFYILWFTYFISAGTGLMVIGSVAGMAKQSLGSLAFLAVAIMAVGNAAGRIVVGSVSDRIGRQLTLVILLFFQAVLMFTAVP